MIDDPLAGILGPLITETRDDEDIAAVIGLDAKGIRRVRGFEPHASDVQGSGKFIPFLVYVILDAAPDPDIPVTFATVGFRCYGSTPQGAWAIYAALAKALHRVGPRVVSALGVYQTLIASGGVQTYDPDTKQPVITGSISLLATAQAFAA